MPAIVLPEHAQLALRVLVDYDSAELGNTRKPHRVKYAAAELLIEHGLAEQTTAALVEPTLEGRKHLAALDGETACRECGCTDARACAGGCSWVEPDLCSSCA